MSDLLVNKTSQTSQASTDSFVDVDGLFETVIVGSASSVLLLIATLPIDQSDTFDECVAIRFAVDDVLEGPEVTALKDNINEGCGASLCYVVTGLSGSHKFALQWQSVGSKHVNTDTGRVRSFQVIEITNASIVVNQSSQAADDAVSGFTDIVDLSATPTIAAGSVLLVLANTQGNLDSGSTEWLYDSRLTIDGTHEGPQLIVFKDSPNEGCGQSMMWFTEGLSGSVAFAAQWDELEAVVDADTGRVRTLQVVEITDLVNLLTQIVSQAADTLTGAYTDVVDLVDTVSVDGPDSILLFAASIPQAGAADATGAYRFHEGGTPEGPEQYIFSDNFDPHVCGHSIYHAATGKSAGSHTFSLRGQNVIGTVPMDTARNRSLAILELTAGDTGLPRVIAGVDLPNKNQYGGPFLSSGGDTYLVFRDSADDSILEVFKTGDPETAPFIEQDSANKPNFTNNIESLWVFQDGDDLHIAIQEISTGRVSYTLFHMATDLYDGTHVDTIVDTPTDPLFFGCSIAVRDDGDVIVVYQGDSDKIMGTDFARVRYARKENGTFATAGVEISNGGEIDWVNGVVIKGSNDRMHIFFEDRTNLDGYQRTLRSDNTLETFPAAGDATLSAEPSFGMPGYSFVDGATTKIRCPYTDANGTIVVAAIDSVDSPGAFVTEGPTSTFDVQRFAGRSPDGGLTGFDGVWYSVFVNAPTQDIFLREKGFSDIELVDAVSGERVSSNALDRDGAFMIGYVYRDGASIIRYDEVQIRAPGASALYYNRFLKEGHHGP